MTTLGKLTTKRLELLDIPTWSPEAHFLDSGSFSLWTAAERFAKETGKGEWEFYDTADFYSFLEEYVAFVKKFRKAIDLCANVDVLPFTSKKTPPKGFDNASLSYRNLKLLEKMGLDPVPVVHLGADPNIWIRRYIEEGYPLIGLGGMVGSGGRGGAADLWLNRVFDFATDKDGYALCRFHGFGVTSHDTILRYPWYSVDSTTWIKRGAYGDVIVPRRKKDNWVLVQDDLYPGADIKLTMPWIINVSEEYKDRFVPGEMHYFALSSAEKKVVDKWFDEIGVIMGSVGGDKDGLLNSHYVRKEACLYYFEYLRKRLKSWNSRVWQKSKTSAKGFGLFKIDPIKRPKETRPFKLSDDNFIIFYSGTLGGAYDPECRPDIGNEACVMLTFLESRKVLTPRFIRLFRARGGKI